MDGRKGSGGKGGGGGGSKQRAPRHQQRRPSRLSMDLIDTPSAEPPPVLGEVTAAAGTATATAQARPRSPSSEGTHSPVGTIRVAAERLPTAAAAHNKGGKGDKGDKGGKGSGSRSGKQNKQQQQQQQQQQGKGSRSPSGSGSPSQRRHTHPAQAASGVRVSSPLCTEVGVASVHSPKAAAAAGGAGSRLAAAEGAGRRSFGEELEDLPLDQSGEEAKAKATEEEEECIEAEAEAEAEAEGMAQAAKRGGAAATGAAVFRPLSPLVLPVLSSPRMRAVLGAETLERLAQTLEEEQEPRHTPQGSGSNSHSRSSSPVVVLETLKTLAKKAVASAAASVGSAPASAVVAPTPIRLSDGSSPSSSSSSSATGSAAAVVVLSPQSSHGGASPFTQVKAHHHHGSSSNSSKPLPPPTFAPSKPVPHLTGLAGSGSGLVGAVASFPFVVGACLLACGLSQAGIEWYTTALGSDFSTWWAGAVCAALGLATMALRRTPTLASSFTRRHAGQTLYCMLAVGAVAAIICALFLDLKLLDGLNKADRCGAATDNLVLDNGIVLTQTMGAACGVQTGCACVQYTAPIPGGEVSCLNFPRAAADTCASIPYSVAGLVRVSIWCIAGLLFFMAVLLLRAGNGGGGAAHDEPSSSLNRGNSVHKVRSLGGVLSGLAGQGRRRRRRNTWHSNAAVASINQAGEGSDGEEEDEEEEEDVEGAIAQGQALSSSSKAAALAALSSLHRSAQLLTPIPEYGPTAAAPAAPAGLGEEEDEEDEEVILARPDVVRI